jgi:hypothetical protein
MLQLACLAGATLLAQTTSGSITGTVLDPNGALVPGAKVIANHTGTGVVAETATTDAGIYLFPSLPVGEYKLTVEHAGFKQLVRSNIEVRVGSRVTLDMKLELGESKETVQVTAEVPLLETTSAQRGTNFLPSFMDKLPIYSGGIRNAENFVTYMPGVNSGAETSISGSGGRAKEILIDGGSNVSPESGGMAMQNMGMEAFTEFKLTTASYSAELGRFGGGVEMFTTKSGTNELHGSGFWGLRRDILNAAGFASNAVVGRKPGYRAKERYNEAGASVGGPIFIPKLYDGRNKSFFFFTYSRDMRPMSFSTANYSVPSAAMKNGNFSELSYAIFDPATTAGSVRTPFAGNLIPTSRWSAVSKKFVTYIPDPMNSATTNNYTHNDTTVYKNYIWTIKGDHQFNAAHRISFYLQRFYESSDAVSYFDGPMGSGLLSFNKPDQVRANHDWIIRPTMLLHTTFSFSSTRQTWNNPQQRGFASTIGIPTQGGDSDTTPNVAFSDSLRSYTPLGSTNGGKVDNGGQWNYTYHMSGYMSWMRGKHEIKMGWDVRRLQTKGHDKAGTGGFFTFNSYQTADPTSLNKTGNAFASLLLGEAYQMAQAALPITDGNIRYGYHAGYIQDNWRLSSRLTLEIGVRYEVPKGWHDKYGNYSTVDLGRPNPAAGNLAGALVFAGNGAGRENKNYLYTTDYTNIGPRLGFAYRIADKTVLRGGWGMYYQTLGNGGCGCTSGFNYTVSVGSSGADTFANWDKAIPYPSGYTPPPSLTPDYLNGTAATTMGDTYAKAPRVYTWSASLQHEIRGFLIELGYVGNRGNGLNSTLQLNQLPFGKLALGSMLTRSITSPEAIAAGYTQPFAGFSTKLGTAATVMQALKNYPQFTNLFQLNSGAGKTWYDAFQLKVEKRKGALMMMANYTFSKSLSTMHYRQIFSQTDYATQDAYNLADAKSFLPFHQAHVTSLLISYDLPFGKGKRLLGDSNKIVNAIVSNWNLGAAEKFRSGNLVRLAASSNTLGSYLNAMSTKANLTGTAIRTGTDRKDLSYNNTAKRYFSYDNGVPFANPAAYNYGTAAFYQPEFRQPPVLSDNISLVKQFSIEERYRFTLRADAFNAFNRTNFSVGTTWTAASFGVANGVQNGPRVITLGLRLDF